MAATLVVVGFHCFKEVNETNVTYPLPLVGGAVVGYLLLFFPIYKILGNIGYKYLENPRHYCVSACYQPHFLGGILGYMQPRKRITTEHNNINEKDFIMNQDLYQELFKNTETKAQLNARLEREVYKPTKSNTEQQKQIIQPLDVFMDKFGTDEHTCLKSIDDMYYEHIAKQANPVSAQENEPRDQVIQRLKSNPELMNTINKP
ncbi:hypothetical protein FM038_014075 [Shewanella eurypsychrophilus]|uniref:Uncharacterized protein n=1 Tax=Shewanella eurypsychrophilus TaxID=2593656 RepID=A0ABX6V7G8_9GAMM|nr:MULTISPECIES: hypothetical protein [Shewanella]QFU23162.1 hypothetical protein FS418_15655 [Shewanella sp. YLB-09]QPG58445.1 hypothetical protein FM038_014075 [Shewanella eurypsychrophilus]